MGPGQVTVAVGAVIEDARGRVLLVKHVPQRQGFWQGKWICPGGRLELGETLADGVRREVREETGLEIRLKRLLPPFERIVSGHAGGTALHVIYVDYLAEMTGGRLQPGSDVGEAVWVPRGELETLRAEMHEDTQRLLENAGLLERPRQGRQRPGAAPARSRRDTTG